MKCRTLWISFVILSIIISVISCSQQKTKWKGTIEEKDGVIIVKNPREPMYEEDVFSLEEELSIGEIDGPEEYRFENIWFVVADDRERIYVSEGAGNLTHIKVFDKSGNHITTIGRQGQGPGEFSQISNIQITPENELMVHDRSSHKLTFFSLDGEYLRTILYTGVEVGELRVTSKGEYLVRTMNYQSPINPDSLNVSHEAKKYSSDFKFIRMIAKDSYRKAVALQSWMMIRFLSSDSFMCGNSETNEFQIYNPEGELVRTIMRDFKPIEINQDEKQKRGLTRYKDLPSHFPAFQDFSMDEEGRIYAQLYERQMDKDKYYFDVYNPEGIYLAKVPLNALPKCWKNGKMYTVEEDEEGYQYIKRYKVTWNY